MIAWFKRHPDYLRMESESLARDGNYKQLFLVRNRLLVSHGNILVRLDKIHRFPVLIVYPDATPFELPAFYILKAALDEQTVADLSHLEPFKLAQAVKPFVRFYYELRHQNSSGALCIMEWDNLDEGAKYYGIPTLLKRVRDWCAGTLTGVFPPDSQEIEFASHFNDLDPELKYIYPQSFLDPDLVCGEAYAQLYTFLPKLEETALEHRIYMGCLVVGEDAHGVTRAVDFKLHGLLKEEGFSSPADLYTKTFLLQQKLDSKDWLKCFWFHLETAPAPFSGAEELTTLIGNGERTAGLNRMHRLLAPVLKNAPAYFYIGLRFPNRKGELEFQVFKVYKTEHDKALLYGNFPPEEIMESYLSAYTRVSAVECEKLTEETFHLRNSGRADHDKLRGKIVNIIGAGALGSEIADAVAKAGPGGILLFDNQRMRAHNTVRHLSGFNHMGIPKVFAVANVLRQHNPFVEIAGYPVNINHVNIEEFLPDESVSVSSIADDNVEAYLNERAILSGKTVFYTRALRGGKAARIFRVIPGRDACLHCLDLYRKGGGGFIDIPEDEDLPTLKNECNNPIRPASAADLKLIASITSRIVIDYLQNGPAEENHWIWSTEPLETSTPLGAWQLHAQSLPPHPLCLYCHHGEPVKVTFSSSALAQMQELVAKNPDTETGGVLAGYMAGDGSLDVRFASGPGPNAICLPTKFEKDDVFCQAFLDGLIQEKGAIYLGEWHSHPSANNTPSGTDLKSLSEIAVSPEYLTDHPLMVILSSSGKPSFTVHPANKIYYHVDALIESNQ